MKFLPRKSALTLLAATMVSFSAPIVSVEARNLFDVLFNHDRQEYRYDRREYRYDRRGQLRERPVQRPRVVKKKPRVKTARYYNYRAAAVKSVALKALVKQASSAGYVGPQLQDADRNGLLFAESISQLQNFAPKARKDITKAVINHYKDNPGFIWVKDNKPSEVAISLMRVLESADEYGLDNQDYQIDASDVGTTEDVTGSKLSDAIRFELTLSLRAVRYALDAKNGRVNPNKLSGYHDFPGKKLKAATAIAAIFDASKIPNKAPVEPESTTTEATESTSTSSIKPVNVSLSGAEAVSQDVTVAEPAPVEEKPNAADYLLSLHPGHPAFKSFKKELLVLKRSVDDAVVVAPDTFVRPGKSHVEMPNIVKAIKKRGSGELIQLHQEVFDTYDGSELYSEQLVDLIKGFQKENKLKPDGIVGRRTVSKMSDTPIATKVNRVKLAMERLRWHPRDFGNRHVFINQPAYRASYMVGGKTNLSMRVVVGKRSNQTNFFHDKIERVVYNPYWGVPRSILVNEMLPKLRNNPGYLDQRGYEVTTVSGKQISSASVDWYTVGANFGYNVRQKPGRSNALGELKILFPNKHNIYMHDTPSKSLFKRSVRALSHGCVRLQQPRQMAAAVLGTNMSTIKKRLGSGHNSQKLKSHVPVYVAYFTAWTDDDGAVLYYGDIYGRDKALLKAIKKTSVARGTVQS